MSMRPSQDGVNPSLNSGPSDLKTITVGGRDALHTWTDGSSISPIMQAVCPKGALSSDPPPGTLRAIKLLWPAKGSACIIVDVLADPRTRAGVFPVLRPQ